MDGIVLKKVDNASNGLFVLFCVGLCQWRDCSNQQKYKDAHPEKDSLPAMLHNKCDGIGDKENKKREDWRKMLHVCPSRKHKYHGPEVYKQDKDELFSCCRKRNGTF